MVAPIRHGRMHFGASLPEVVAALFQPKFGDRAGVIIPSTDHIHPSSAVLGRVYRGLWIADCEHCGDAEVVFVEQPLFMCVKCWNATDGGAWRRVLLPPNRPAIEAVLMARPIPDNRNWTAGETVADLRAENRAHGLPETVGLVSA